MTARAQEAGPARAGAGLRPPWKVRGLIRRDDPTGPVVCLRLPAGFAGTPEQAISQAREKFPDAMRMLHPDRWRAFPVTDAEGEVL